MIRVIDTPLNLPIYYQGPPIEKGPLPAFFYFSLSGEESLTLAPYNSPAAKLVDSPLRVFSITIPCHGEGFNKLHAMQCWAERMQEDLYFLEDFFNKTQQSLRWLIDASWIDPNHLAVGGLSRGGFIAAHIAARIKEIRILLGFAPLCDLNALEEFSSSSAHFKEHIDALRITSLVDELTHLHHLRFYIGNRDERVSTDACYQCVRHLAEKAHEKNAKRCNIELFITQSIGHKGHGTAPHIFEEGTLWLKQHLLGR